MERKVGKPHKETFIWVEWNPPHCSVHSFHTDKSKCFKICMLGIVQSKNNAHSFHTDKSKCRKTCTPGIVQSKNIHSSQSYPSWFPARMPKHKQEDDPQIPLPKPCHCQGAHEEALTWDPNHNTQAVKNKPSTHPHHSCHSAKYVAPLSTATSVPRASVWRKSGHQPDWDGWRQINC